MILTNDGKKDFLSSNFHQYFDIILNTPIQSDKVMQHVNLTLPLSKIDDIYDLEAIRKFFNDEYNNVIFTSSDNSSIYRYEFYKDIYFIRMEPFDNIIRMHIIPKKYDASDAKTSFRLLFFKDSKEIINDDNFSCSDDYTRNESLVINSQYLYEDKQTSNAFYKFNIKEYTKNITNLQINAGYSYNETTPNDERKHYIGIIDESDESGKPISTGEFTEFNAALMDANYDQLSTYTNVSKQQKYNSNGISWPTEYTPYSDGIHDTKGFNNTHNLNTVFHKTIKYYNDDIYIEENNSYILQSWKEDR